jgi:hypothetical protein
LIAHGELEQGCLIIMYVEFRGKVLIGVIILRVLRRKVLIKTSEIYEVSKRLILNRK